jgi:DNA repair protein RecN (Recombination protein N)
MARFDPRARSIEELLEGAVIQAREAAGALRRYAEGVDLDPERLAWLEDRVAAVESLARKHRVTARELPDHQARLEARLAEIEQGDERLAALETELEPLERRYAELVARLHAGRLEAAPRLARAIEANARPLGMADARVDVQVQPTPAEVPTPHGRDRIEFLFSANPGQPLAPLGQVASGGELSRVSLAIQLIGARGRGVPTQIFDEVDAGVGGRVADAVGQALRQLAGSCQVLCVTHLPQVAAQGQQHLEVSKAARDGHTFAHVALLGAEARVRELARMLGGAKITARALDHAREMLERPEVRARRGAGLGRPGR